MALPYHPFLNDYKYNEVELSQELKDLLHIYLNENDILSVLSSGECDYSQEKLDDFINEYIKKTYPLILSEKREKIADSQYIGKIE